MANPPDILIVGSVPLPDAEGVMRAVAETLGERVRRIPDGETGERLNWIEWQAPVFEGHPAFEAREFQGGGDEDWRDRGAQDWWQIRAPQALRPEANPAGLEFGPLGYAGTAQASFAVFSALKAEGVIPAACRFQVCLPTPYNVLDQRIVLEHRLLVEPAYERRMLAEVAEIAAAIPHDQLAIQWDVAHEVQNLDGGRAHWFDDPEQGILKRLIRLGEHVPEGIDLGYHLCYGDFRHRHFVEPDDTGTVTRVANGISAGLGRPLTWLHMPVPRDRIDDAYFAPLAGLKLRPETRLYLGLVHFTDGVGGTRHRMAAARKVVGDFGIATECGFGRRPPETVLPLLRIHATVAETEEAENG